MGWPQDSGASGWVLEEAAQGLLLEGLVAHLGGPERYLEAGAALKLQRPPQCPEAGAEVGGAGAGGG